MRVVNAHIENADYDRKQELPRDTTWCEVIDAGLFILDFANKRQFRIEDLTAKLIEKFPEKK